LGHPPESIIAILAHELLRQDAGFHPYQIFEAGCVSSTIGPNLNREVALAIARYLAAHAPTERAWLQTADIARRLSRGDQL